MGIVIGIVLVLAVAAFFAVMTCKSKYSDLYKWILIAIFVAVCITWIVPYGQFNGATYTEYAMKRVGLTDIPSILYYAAYFGLQSIIYLFILGGFYGVLSKTNSYSMLVKNISKKFKGKETLFMVIISSIIVILTSLVKNTFALLIFIPFIVSILLSMKTNKLTTFAVTFGSLLAGLCAATYGTDGLNFLHYYMNTQMTSGLIYRVIIACVALVLYEGLLAFHLVRSNKKKTKTDKEEEIDPYAAVEVKGKVSTVPVIILFAVLFVFTILGFVAWSDNWNISVFTKFHEWLTGLKIGKDFEIFSYILGASATEFGKFELTSLITILLVSSVIIALASKQKVNEFLTNFGDGAKKMLKPVSLYVLVYVVFIVAYTTPFIPAFTNWAYGLTKKFNPYIATVVAFITSIFHADLGFTGYAVGSLFNASYLGNVTLIQTIYTTTYGLAQIFMPVSGLLMVGLSYLKVDYKSWFKYIWMFALAMLAVLLIFATIVYY